MRVFITVLVLIFSLQSWTKANDVSEFEIEGMSIGSSLLDHFNKNEILTLIKSNNSFFYKGNAFVSITTHANYSKYPNLIKNEPILNIKEKYDYLGAVINPDDNNFIIFEISAYINFPNDIDSCIKKKNEIVKDISFNFDGIKSDNETSPHSYDKSGKSIAHNSWFTLDIGTLSVHCEDWSKEFEDIGWSDKLKVRLMSDTIMDFLRNVQYK